MALLTLKTIDMYRSNPSSVIVRAGKHWQTDFDLIIMGILMNFHREIMINHPLFANDSRLTIRLYLN